MFIGEYDYDLDMQVKAEEAREEGLAEGRKEGLSEGQLQKAIEATTNLLKLNKLSAEQIASTIGLPLEQVLELQKQISVTI